MSATRDVTMQVIEAQEARSRMQEAKKRIKSEVRRKYESRIAEEVAERTQDAEIEFAKTLARVHASGVSQATLRRDVLRTNVWSVWTYWRDLADIEPERVTAGKEREETKRPYRWEEGQWAGQPRPVLVWLKDKKGKNLEVPINIIIDPEHLTLPDWTEHDLAATLKVFSNRANLMELAQPVINERFKKESE